MATPFDHLDQFKKLDARVKEAFLEKFKQLSPEDQNVIMSKINTPMEQRASEGVTPDLLPISKPELEKYGEEVATGKMAVNHPVLAAVAGTGIAKADDILAAASGLRNVKTLAEGAVAGAKALAQGAKGLGNLSRAGLDMLFGQGEGAAKLAGKQAQEALQERLTKQAQALGTLPERQAARGAELATAKDQYGRAIGKVEELGGYALKETPEAFLKTLQDPQALNKMSRLMRKVGDTPSTKLAENVDPGTLQVLRKFAQTFREVGPDVTKTISANIKMGGGASTEALKRLDPALGSVIDSWQGVAGQLERLPADAAKQKAAVKGAMLQTRLAMKKTQHFYDIAIQAGAKRDAVRKALITAGVPTLFAGMLIKGLGGK